ncbi:MAG: methionine--tRNA ligase [Candidatus Woesearchaeota archaeon]|jgi:methionyl-tRNA synthetase
MKSVESKTTNRILITAALPYANGSIHLGHMVEYIEADIYTRALKLFGKNAIFVCADDTHGAPIEIKASSLKLKPEQLIAKYYEEHTKDFSDFNIHFDSYYSTNSPENKQFSDYVFNKLKDANTIYKKSIEVIYCEHCKRFLPDRYVKGTCPKCKEQDQYGDVCEKCSNTHKTTDLINPLCSICGKVPVKKISEHYFFKLSAYKEKLKHFFQTAQLQPEIVNSVNSFLEDLQDWCISRDGPYFGFKIPGEENKYYYVWLDAPIGYIASTANYCKISKESVDDYWKNSETKIVHFIGKDIVYFHFLFWPAMLMTSGFTLPSQINVHGFLTVNKEKMSKSRGTFITARQYLDILNPEYLRFYYAAHLSQTVSDLDLDLAEFKEKVNNELISNIANFCYRVLSFSTSNCKGDAGHYHEKDVADEITELRQLFKSIQENYEKINFKNTVHDILTVSSIGNKYFQKHEPWKLIKENPKKAKEIIAFCTDIIKNLSILIAPILPVFSEKLQQQLNVSNIAWKDLNFNNAYNIKNVTPLLMKLDNEHEKLIVTSQKKEFPLLMRVGKIISAEDHPNAEKLFVEKVDFGTEIRTIISGIKQWYKKEELVGKQVIAIVNLKPAKLRGVMSEGMLLTGEHEDKVILLEAPHSKLGDIVYFEKNANHPAQIEYTDFTKVPLNIKQKNIMCETKALKTDTEIISINMPDGSKVK